MEAFNTSISPDLVCQAIPVGENSRKRQHKGEQLLKGKIKSNTYQAYRVFQEPQK